MTDDQANRPAALDGPPLSGEVVTPGPGAPARSRAVVRVVMASVAVTALCAAAVAAFGSPPAARSGDVNASPRAPVAIAGQLSSPAPWPSARSFVTPSLPITSVDAFHDSPSGKAEAGHHSAPAGGVRRVGHHGGPAGSGESGSSRTSRSKPAASHGSGGHASRSGGGGGGESSGGGSTSSHHSGSTSTSSGSGRTNSQKQPAAPKTQPSGGRVFITGQASCSSGRPIVGFWVQAAKGAGYASWKGVGDGTNADYWYYLPVAESYSLHIGCGGTPANWGVPVGTPTVGYGHNSFNCVDVPGQSGYGTCRLR